MLGRASAICAFLSLQVYIATPSELRAEELKLLIRPPVPPLVGPDTVEPAPALVVSDERTELDGREVTSDELGQTLRTLVGNYKILHPQVPFNGKILIACAPETSTRRLSEHLRLALATGFPNPMFLLIQPNPAAKNDKSADRITAALATMKKNDAATSVKTREHVNCVSLVKAVIAKRNQGKVVFLDIGAEESRRSSRAAAQPGVAPDSAARRR